MRYLVMVFDDTGARRKLAKCETWAEAVSLEARIKANLPDGVYVMAWCHSGKAQPTASDDAFAAFQIESDNAMHCSGQCIV